jgi:hypothetical protein
MSSSHHDRGVDPGRRHGAGLPVLGIVRKTNAGGRATGASAAGIVGRQGESCVDFIVAAGDTPTTVMPTTVMPR